MLMFRWRKLSVLFARLHIFAMWTFHLKSDDIVILDLLRMSPVLYVVSLNDVSLPQYVL